MVSLKINLNSFCRACAAKYTSPIISRKHGFAPKLVLQALSDFLADLRDTAFPSMMVRSFGHYLPPSQSLFSREGFVDNLSEVKRPRVRRYLHSIGNATLSQDLNSRSRASGRFNLRAISGFFVGTSSAPATIGLKSISSHPHRNVTINTSAFYVSEELPVMFATKLVAASLSGHTKLGAIKELTWLRRFLHAAISIPRRNNLSDGTRWLEVSRTTNLA